MYAGIVLPAFTGGPTATMKLKTVLPVLQRSLSGSKAPCHRGIGINRGRRQFNLSVNFSFFHYSVCCLRLVVIFLLVLYSFQFRQDVVDIDSFHGFRGCLRILHVSAAFHILLI